MKKILVIALFLVACGSNSSKHSSNPIIGTPKKLGNIQIAENDFVESMYWGAANTSCKILGTGWRLPTKEELNEMYLNKDKIGGFSSGVYWSSSEGGLDGAWVQDFTNGDQFGNGKDGTSRVRAVRAF